VTDCAAGLKFFPRQSYSGRNPLWCGSEAVALQAGNYEIGLVRNEGSERCKWQFRRWLCYCANSSTRNLEANRSRCISMTATMEKNCFT
jgi:hypothetical protein